MDSIKSFKSSLRHYHSLGSVKGVANCQLGILKICHDRFSELTSTYSDFQKKEFLEKCDDLLANAIECYKEINSLEGVAQ